MLSLVVCSLLEKEAENLGEDIWDSILRIYLHSLQHELQLLIYIELGPICKVRDMGFGTSMNELIILRDKILTPLSHLESRL